MKSKRKVEKLYEKFRIRQKDVGTVLAEVKQTVLAKVVKIECYNERIKQYKQIDSLLLIRKNYLLS